MSPQKLYMLTLHNMHCTVTMSVLNWAVNCNPTATLSLLNRHVLTFPWQSIAV